MFGFVREYCENNPEMKDSDLGDILTKLLNIGNRQIGIIELSDQLEIDLVTDIFIRINSKGTSLSQGDFVMSKIAADEKFGGNQLRKAIDYFSHLAVEPSFYSMIKEGDSDFVQSDYFPKMAWLKDDLETVFDPDCDDVLRVAFMHKFQRAKLADLVGLLSGRDFKTREYNETIIESTYKDLIDGVKNVINENNFKQFMIAIKGAGFVSNKLVTSNMALDFAYTLYLILKKNESIAVGEVKRLVQKWYVLSVLTGRYSSSSETTFAKDLRAIAEFGVVKVLNDIENATLSDNFWDVKIVQDLEYTSTNNPTFLVFLATQIARNEVSLLSNNVSVHELVLLGGDIHHIFPKDYLKKLGHEKSSYNQDANYVYLDKPVNQSIGNKAPNVYFEEAFNQCDTKEIKVGAIVDKQQLLDNLKMNCISENVRYMDESNYAEFLEQRRKMMAQKIKEYYYSL